MECAWASGDEGSVNPLIKGGQFAAAFHGEGEEVNVGQILRSWEVWEKGGIAKTQIIRPELETWRGFKTRQDPPGFESGTRSIGVWELPRIRINAFSVRGQVAHPWTVHSFKKRRAGVRWG